MGDRRGRRQLRQAQRAMRSTRRRRFVGQFDNVMETLYRVYVAAFFGAIAGGDRP